MISNQELVSRFFNGEFKGTAANMSIGQTAAGGHFIMGYGHAVYAYRPPDDRFDPVVFTGWKGASSSTNQHISLMADETDLHADGRPGTTDVRGDPDKDLVMGIAGNDNDYSTNHRSFSVNRGP